MIITGVSATELSTSAISDVANSVINIIHGKGIRFHYRNQEAAKIENINY